MYRNAPEVVLVNYGAWGLDPSYNLCKNSHQQNAHNQNAHPQKHHPHHPPLHHSHPQNHQNLKQSPQLMVKAGKRLRLTWDNLTYKINETKWSLDMSRFPRSSSEKVILQEQSGQLVGGTITALMGPSGAGKSSLLSCITGRFTIGLKGRVSVHYPLMSEMEKKKRNVTIASVPQNDSLFPQFTVLETLIFASKMKNREKDHVKEANKVIQALNLESCTNLRLTGCSGGQSRRVSIGVELISHPDILVLDEPTSGLDSTNAVIIIQLLQNLAKKSLDQPAIVTTIHQPNHTIFNFFDQIYLLSKNGHKIYCGSPGGIIRHFNHCPGLVQPEFSSPADYAIEVASGNYGTNVFPFLEEVTKSDIEPDYIDSNESKVVPIQKIVSKMRNRKMPAFYQWLLLMNRSIMASCFKSPQVAFKIVMNIVIAGLISMLWAEPTGIEDGCWQSQSLKESILSHSKETARDAYMDKITKITANCNLLFSTCIYFILVYSIGTVLVIPLEIATVMKEMSNSWYHVGTYFFAKTTADIPAIVISIASLEAICWFFTEQVWVLWRFFSVLSLSCLMGIVCESIGVLFGIILSDDLVSATLVTMASSFPILMFAGFLIKVADIPWYFSVMTYISYARYSFEGILTSIYGFGRCEDYGISSDDFMKELASAQNPVEFISTLWSNFNVTGSDAKMYAPIIGVPESHLESVINGTSNFLGLNSAAFNSDLPEIVPSHDSEPSYVMSYFKLSDDHLQNSFVSLILIVFILKSAIYCLLSYKTKKRQ